MTRHESIRFTLLDQQLVDSDDRRIGRVDDLVWEAPTPGERPRITHLLVGAQALGHRLGGITGHLMARVARRLQTKPGEEPAAIPVDLVGDHQDLVRLRVPLRDLPHVAGLERWLADNVIGPLPGAGDADQ
jgi:hypothetical protein